MTLEKLAEMIAAEKTKMLETDIVKKIASITQVPFLRAVKGYRMMREKGLINNIVIRHSVGSIDAMINNDAMMNIIDRFDMIVTAEIGIMPDKLANKPSAYKPNEILPNLKMTPQEISDWINEDIGHITYVIQSD